MMVGPTQFTPMYCGASRLVVSPHLFPQRRLLPDGGTSTTPLRRPGDAEQTAFGEQTAELLCHCQIGRIVGERTEKRRGHVSLDELSDVRTERIDVPTHLEVHPVASHPTAVPATHRLSRRTAEPRVEPSGGARSEGLGVAAVQEVP